MLNNADFQDLNKSLSESLLYDDISSSDDSSDQESDARRLEDSILSNSKMSS